MREKRKGKPAIVSIGYGQNKKNKKQKIIIHNLKEIEKVGNKIVIIGNVGKKKKIEIAKKLKEKKIVVQNFNVQKFLKKINKKKEEK